MTYLSVASITIRADAARFEPSEVSPGARSATTRSPSIRTSAWTRPVGLTTVPPRINVVIGRFTSSRTHEVVVGLRAAVTVERPAFPDLQQQVHVEVADNQLGILRVTL